MTQDTQAKDNTQVTMNPLPWRAVDVPSQGWTIVWGPDDGTLRPICHMRWTDGLRPMVEARIEAEAKFIAEACNAFSALCTVRDTLQARVKELEDARDRVRASFGHRNAEGKCQCVYCRGDAEGIFEHAADYELRNFGLHGKLETVEAERDALSARVTALEDEKKTKEEKIMRADPREASSHDDASACNKEALPSVTDEAMIKRGVRIMGDLFDFKEDVIFGGGIQPAFDGGMLESAIAILRAVLDDEHPLLIAEGQRQSDSRLRRALKMPPIAPLTPEVTPIAKDGEAGSSTADPLNAERKA